MKVEVADKSEKYYIRCHEDRICYGEILLSECHRKEYDSDYIKSHSYSIVSVFIFDCPFFEKYITYSEE